MFDSGTGTGFSEAVACVVVAARVAVALVVAACELVLAAAGGATVRTSRAMASNAGERIRRE